LKYTNIIPKYDTNKSGNIIQASSRTIQLTSRSAKRFSKSYFFIKTAQTIHQHRHLAFVLLRRRRRPAASRHTAIWVISWHYCHVTYYLISNQSLGSS